MRVFTGCAGSIYDMSGEMQKFIAGGGQSCVLCMGRTTLYTCDAVFYCF